MIIQIRGTHGAGKSHLVRAVMDKYENRKEVRTDKTVLGYRLDGGLPTRLFVPGNYPGDVGGGCDTIGTMDEIFDPVRIMGGVVSVLFEGIVAQHSMPRMHELRDDITDDIDIVVLSTSVEDCIASVEARRRARGNTKPLDPKNLKREHKSVLSVAGKLETAGFRIHHLDRAAALKFVIDRLSEVSE